MSVDICVFAQEHLLDQIGAIHSHKANILSKFGQTKRLQYTCLVNKLNLQLQAKMDEFVAISQRQRLTATQYAFYQNIYSERLAQALVIESNPVVPMECDGPIESPRQQQERLHRLQSLGKLTKWNGTEQLYKRNSPRRLTGRVTKIKGRRTGSRKDPTLVRLAKEQRKGRLMEICDRLRRKLF